MNMAEIKDFWRWKMFRQAADFIADPSDKNRMKLNALMVAYSSHRSELQDLEEDSWYQDVS